MCFRATGVGIPYMLDFFFQCVNFQGYSFLVANIQCKLISSRSKTISDEHQECAKKKKIKVVGRRLYRGETNY